MEITREEIVEFLEKFKKTKNYIELESSVYKCLWEIIIQQKPSPPVDRS